MTESFLNRRVLLQTFLASAFVGSVLQPSITMSHLTSQSVVEQARELIALDHWRRNFPEIEQSSIREQMSVKFDDLLGMIMARFDGNITISDAKAVFSQNIDLTKMSDSHLAALAESIVPLAVVRELCRSHGVFFDAGQCVNFEEFMGRYSEIILEI